MSANYELSYKSETEKELLTRLDVSLLHCNSAGEIYWATPNILDILLLDSEAEPPRTMSQLFEILSEYDVAHLRLLLSEAISDLKEMDVAMDFPNREDPKHVIRMNMLPFRNSNTDFEVSLYRLPKKDKAKIAIYSSRKRFQNFIQNMPNAISYKNCNSEIISVNKQWHKMFNPEGLPVEGRTISDFLVESHADASLRSDAEILAGGTAFEKETHVRLKNGTEVYSLSQKFPLKDHHGNIVGVGTIHTDMSRQNAVAQELNRAKEAAEIANRSKSEFLANMSHELRTPLNAIIGFSEILQNELFGPMGVPAYKEYVDDINDGARHLLEILNDILDMSKVEAGEYHLEEEIFETHLEVERCLRFIKERASKNGLEVILAPLESDPLLNADRRVFKQILLNILSNAVKFTERGGTITISIHENKNKELEIEIKDTGIGIAEEDIPLVLQPFGQADTSLTRQVEGTGLGLSLVQRFMDLHQGRLILESELGVGTQVTVIFPRIRWNWEFEGLLEQKELAATFA
ncbi:MAG: PAS domain-containing sensor histidine kinase [Alphaproteobacteria bacterium]|nr:PAS domain-containing sensor histidine kinase [Alphaproteobacteria bacterium]